MLKKNPTEHLPIISKKAFIDDTAVICGHVIIEDNVYVGPYAVLRADEIDSDGQLEPIIIRQKSNIQDAVIIHGKGGAGVEIGERTSIAHRALIHGPCWIGNDVFVGFNSIIFNSHINHGCVIEHSVVIDDASLNSSIHVPSASNINNEYDLSRLQKTQENHKIFAKSVIKANQYLVKGYADLNKD